jgi:hypothetical protein
MHTLFKIKYTLVTTSTPISVELARPKTDTNRDDQTNAEVSISAESLILKDISTPPTLTQAGMTVPKPIAKKASPKVKVNESFTSQPNNTIPEKQNNPAHDRAYFRNKIVWGYSDLYKEFSIVKNLIIMEFMRGHYVQYANKVMRKEKV